MIRKLICGVVSLVGLTCPAFGEGKSCQKCYEIQSAILNERKQEAAAVEQLEIEQQKARALSAKSVSQKARLSSNIFILTAKIETARNRRATQSRELAALNCDTCKKAGQNQKQ